MKPGPSRRPRSSWWSWVRRPSVETVFEPGWRWSEHVKPIVGTASCEVHHTGYVMSGTLGVEMDEGASIQLTEGDVFEVPPGHDAWVIGDEPWISIDFAGRRLFAKSPTEASEPEPSPPSSSPI